MFVNDLQKVPKLKFLMRWDKPAEYHSEYCPCAEHIYELIV